MASKSYSETLHYWCVSIYPDDVEEGPVYGGPVIRGTEYDGSTEIETTEYKGHTGSKTMVLTNDRTSATAEPSYTHGAIFGEFLEDYFKLLLGYDEKEQIIEYEDGVDDNEDPIMKPINTWVFKQDLEQAPSLPKCTIVNGYAGVGADANDARVYDNALMSELNLKIDDNGVELEPSFVSNAPVINQPNPTKLIVDKLHKVGLKGVHLYLADFGTGLYDLWKAGEDLSDYEYECLLSYENTWQTNLSEDACIGKDFGVTQADEGQFSSEAKVQFKWNPKSQLILNKWYTNKANGTTVSTNAFNMEALLVLDGMELYVDEGTGNSYSGYCAIYEPKIELTNVTTPESGEDTKTIDVEWEVTENGGISPLITEVQSSLDELHYGTKASYILTSDDTTTKITGTVRGDTVVPVTPDPTPTPTSADVTVTVTDGTNPVDGASITLTDSTDNSITFTGTTGSDGTATITAVTYGTYDVAATATSFNNYTGTTTVSASANTVSITMTSA